MSDTNGPRIDLKRDTNGWGCFVGGFALEEPKRGVIFVADSPLSAVRTACSFVTHYLTKMVVEGRCTQEHAAATHALLWRAGRRLAEDASGYRRLEQTTPPLAVGQVATLVLGVATEACRIVRFELECPDGLAAWTVDNLWVGKVSQMMAGIPAEVFSAIGEEPCSAVKFSMLATGYELSIAVKRTGAEIAGSLTVAAVLQPVPPSRRIHPPLGKVRIVDDFRDPSEED